MTRQSKDKITLTENGALTEEALLAYVSGNLSAEEVILVDKALEQDPFAQDALEGLQSINKDVINTTLSAINNKVRERTGVREKRALQIHWTSYAWAAGLLGLLVGIGFVMINFFGNKDGQIAMNKESAPSTEQTIFEEKNNEQSLVAAPGFADGDSAVSNLQTMDNETASKKSVDLAESATASAAQENTLTLKDEDNQKESKPSTAAASGMGGTTAPPPSAATLPAAKSNLVVAVPATNQVVEKSKEVAARSDDFKAHAEPSQDKKTISKAESPKADVTEGDNVPARMRAATGLVSENEIGGKTASVTIDDAMKNFNSGNYKKSSEQFDEILKRQPQNPDALYFGGISDYINGNEKKSEKNFDKLLKDGSKFNDGSKWYKANILLKKGKKDEARKLLDELVNSGGSYRERAVKKKAEMEF